MSGFRSDGFDKEAANFKNKAMALPLTDKQKDLIASAVGGLPAYFKDRGLSPVDAFMAASMFVEYMKEEYGFVAIAAVGPND